MDNNQNKRIAKNTIFMYIRMAITMCIGLYTSRAVLQALGVEDFGLYNVIGGIVSMFIILNNAMVNTTSRFITVYLAKDDELQTCRIFNMVSFVHIVIAILVVLFAETIGLWYLENKLVVPEGRMFAAHWLYQLSILSAVFSILYVPYNAAIVAHEKMGVFAFIQIADSLLKLIIVLLLAYSPIDKLIFYATLLTILSIADLCVYFIYCKRHFAETKIMFYWNNSVFKEMMGFAGWAVVGNFSNFFYTQGINLLLNAFCGPAANAARGIAVQVEGVVRQFAGNVQMAINPQIIKSYTSRDIERTYTLIFASSKYCFYLLFIVSLPIIVETEFILNKWLGVVPEHTVNFVRLILIISMMDAYINPLYTANLASGKLKLYNLSVCSVSYGFMFITFGAIKYTHIPESVFICLWVSTIIGVLIRIIVLHKQIGLEPICFLKKVLLRSVVVVILSSITPLIIHNIILHEWARFFSVSLLSIVSVLVAVYTVGVNSQERSFLWEVIKNSTQEIKCACNISRCMEG